MSSEVPSFHDFTDHNAKSSVLPTPYVWKIEEGGGVLCFFGAAHSSDIAHPQFSELETHWADFLNHENTNKLVLFETLYDALPENIEEALRDANESGYIAYRARRAGIGTLFPEPDSYSLDMAVRAKFGHKPFLFALVARIMRSAFRGQISTDARDVIVERINKRRSMRYVPTARHELDTLFDEFVPVECMSDGAWWERINNPVTENYHPNNKVVRFITNYRNEVIAATISALWMEGVSVFVVYGRSHAFMLEGYLRERLS